MLLLALFACVPGESECVTEVRDVTEDEVLGDFGYTAADVLADIAGTHALVGGSLGDGTLADGTLRIERGEGPVVFRDRGWVEGPRRLGIGYDRALVFVSCEDAFQLPVDYRFATDDASVALTSSATVTGQAVTAEDRRYEALDEGPPGEAGAWMSFHADEVVAAYVDVDHARFDFPARSP
ncbi:MAG: hypothetical protein ACK4YP_09430 [Myxococcota bacterium]